MKGKIEKISVFLAGGIIYSLIEILWRGYTHWTMTAVGGFCFLLLHFINTRMCGRGLLTKCLVGTGVITAVEFAAGVAVNLILRLDVWDYSSMNFNLLGQVCLYFSAMWFVLCIPAYWFSTVIRQFFEKIDIEENRASGELPGIQTPD